jgi:hypothetical protein
MAAVAMPQWSLESGSAVGPKALTSAVQLPLRSWAIELIGGLSAPDFKYDQHHCTTGNASHGIPR